MLGSKKDSWDQAHAFCAKASSSLFHLLGHAGITCSGTWAI